MTLTVSPAPAPPVRDYALPAGAVSRPRRWRRRALAFALVTDAAAGVSGAAAALSAAPGPAPAALALPQLLGLVLAGLGWVAALALGGVYERRRAGHGPDEFRRVLVSGVVVLAVMSTAGLAGLTAPGQPWSEATQRILTLVGVPLAAIGSLLAHLAARAGLRAMRGRGRCRYRVLAVGKERSVAELLRAARRDPAAGLDVVGACLTRVRRGGARGSHLDGVPVLAGTREVLPAVTRLRADTVLISAWSDVAPEELRQLTWDLEGTGVELLVAPRLTGVTAPRLHVRTVSGTPLVHVRDPELSGFARSVKAGFDLVLAALLVLLLGPLLGAIAVAVKAGSPGPVLFRQERIGRGGRPFRMTKFRSMSVGAEQGRPAPAADGVDRGPLFKLRDDPRVTPLGRWLRRFSLDELPQLFDVLAGRMSLVGPRPQLPHEVRQYPDDVRRRLRVRPGMTGLWQVSGRSDLGWDDAVRLDLHYVENWSLAGDLAIMARTVLAVLARTGAY